MPLRKTGRQTTFLNAINGKYGYPFYSSTQFHIGGSDGRPFIRSTGSNFCLSSPAGAAQVPWILAPARCAESRRRFVFLPCTKTGESCVSSHDHASSAPGLRSQQPNEVGISKAISKRAKRVSNRSAAAHSRGPARPAQLRQQ